MLNHLQINGVKIEKSEDAGEFICNYMFFRSIETSKRIQSSFELSEKCKPKCYSLFIHVPSFTTVAEPV